MYRNSFLTLSFYFKTLSVSLLFQNSVQKLYLVSYQTTSFTIILFIYYYCDSHVDYMKFKPLVLYDVLNNYITYND